MSLANVTASGLVTVTPNTWLRGRALFNNGTTDYLRLGAASTTGTNVGNNAGTSGFFLGGGSAAAINPADIEVGAIAAWNGEPTELAALDTWATNYFGGSVVL
jgi:hypothetical protein